MSKSSLTTALAVIVVIGISAPIVTEAIAAHETFAKKKVSTLTNGQEMAFNALLEMEKLLGALATGLIGGLGAFVASRYKEAGIGVGQLLLSVSAGVAAVSSLIFGYFAYHAIIWMLTVQFFNPEINQVAWNTTGQCCMIGLSVGCFAMFAYREVRK